MYNHKHINICKRTSERDVRYDLSGFENNLNIRLSYSVQTVLFVSEKYTKNKNIGAVYARKRFKILTPEVFLWQRSTEKDVLC